MVRGRLHLHDGALPERNGNDSPNALPSNPTIQIRFCPPVYAICDPSGDQVGLRELCPAVEAPWRVVSPDPSAPITARSGQKESWWVNAIFEPSGDHAGSHPGSVTLVVPEPSIAFIRWMAGQFSKMSPCVRQKAIERPSGLQAGWVFQPPKVRRTSPLPLAFTT